MAGSEGEVETQMIAAALGDAGNNAAEVHAGPRQGKTRRAYRRELI